MACLLPSRGCNKLDCVVALAYRVWTISSGIAVETVHLLPHEHTFERPISLAGLISRETIRRRGAVLPCQLPRQYGVIEQYSVAQACLELARILLAGVLVCKEALEILL